MADSTPQENPSVLQHLESSAGVLQLPSPSFRELSVRVGSVYMLSYNSATVAIYDFHRERAGGLPKGMFLIAAKETGDESFILLRVQREARLPNAAANDEFRQQGIESSGNDATWAASLDPWIREKVSLHAVECSVLGTFIDDGKRERRYAEDIENYYAVNELMAWKPDERTLDLIANHRHRTNDIPIPHKPKRIGKTRFAAAERESATVADFRLNPTDILKRRTVYLGMSRSGKSNGLKVVAESIYRLREMDPAHRIGQLIFDPSGEYAQDNPQDGKALHKVHEAIGLQREGEVETYGLLPVPWDKDRKMLKINFYGDPFPKDWKNLDVEQALVQLLAGREIIKSMMADETALYTKAFRDVDLAVPMSIEGDTGDQIRYKRTILAYQTALFAAGLMPPAWSPSVKGLFGKPFIEAMKNAEYDSAAAILERASAPNGSITWDELHIVFSAIESFIKDKDSGYKEFNETYIRSSSKGEAWADPKFLAIIRIFESANGPRRFSRAQEQHAPKTPIDFPESIVANLRKGKLVIVDQSSGEPDQNADAAERIMWRIFRTQQELFKLPRTTDEEDGVKGHIVVYLEEAHNLLPRANVADKLKTVWARSAKEGSKYNIGLVLATQAPSSIMPEILSETDNWILAYLNSDQERRVIAGYMDFADFLEQIGKVSEQGFVRIRTLSQAYTVPVQLDKFKIADTESDSDGEPSPVDDAVEPKE